MGEARPSSLPLSLLFTSAILRFEATRAPPVFISSIYVLLQLEAGFLSGLFNGCVLEANESDVKLSHCGLEGKKGKEELMFATAGN